MTLREMLVGVVQEKVDTLYIVTKNDSTGNPNENFSALLSVYHAQDQIRFIFDDGSLNDCVGKHARFIFIITQK